MKAKSGKSRDIPVWFVAESEELLLLPMYGLKTKWYQDVERSTCLAMAVGRETLGVTPKFLRDRAQVDKAKTLRSEKYGLADVMKCCPTSEAAIEVGI